MQLRSLNGILLDTLKEFFELEPDTSIEGYRKHVLRVCSEQTALKYVPAVQDFLRALRANGYTDFSDISPGLLNRYVEKKIEEGYSPSSIGVYVSGIQRYIKWLHGQGVAVTPLARPELPRRKHFVRDVLAPEQIKDYLAFASDLPEPLRTATMLLPCTGLRASEMVNLPLKSIRKMNVSFNGKDVSCLALRVFGKGGKERTVPLIDEGEQILLQYLAGYRKSKRGPLVFASQVYKRRSGLVPLTVRWLQGGVFEVRSHLGMRFTAHTMRRTYLTTLYRRGVDAPTIAKIAGHANIQTLFKHYLDIDEQDVVKAVLESKEKKHAT